MCSYKFTFFFVFDLAHIKIQWCSVLIRGVCMVLVVFVGSAATQLRWCYRPNYHFVRYQFLVVTVKKLLKSVFSTLSYAYTKKTPTFLAHPVIYVMLRRVRQVAAPVERQPTLRLVEFARWLHRGRSCCLRSQACFRNATKPGCKISMAL